MPEKASNPFVAKEEWIGRKEWIAQWEHTLDAAVHGRRMAIILEGMYGSGKTMALKNMQQSARHHGLWSAYVSVHEGDDERSMVRKIVSQLREEHPEGAPAAGIATVSKLLTDVDHIAKNAHRGVALFLDDGNEMRACGRLLQKISDMLFHEKMQTGWLIVISGNRFEREYGLERRMLPLLEREDAVAYIERTLAPTKIKIGKECLHLAVEDAAGNPRILLAILRILYDQLTREEKLITKAHYLRTMRKILNMLATLFDDLYYKTSQQERKILRVMAKGEAIPVSELAKRLRLPLNTVTTLALRLVKKGSLVKVERGSYQLFNPLYGRYILKR